MRRSEHQVTAGDVPEVDTGWGDALADGDGGPFWQVHVPGLDIWAESPAVLAGWLRAAAVAVEAERVPVEQIQNGS